MKSKSVLYMLLSALCFSLMAYFVAEAKSIPSIYKILFRNIIILLVILFTIKKDVKHLLGPKKARKWLLLRGILGTLGVFFYFFSIEHLDLADSTLINKSSPIFVTLFAFIFLHERPSKLIWLALGIAFTGTILVVKPGLNSNLIAAIGGILGSICAGGAYTVIRRLGSENVDKLTIILYFSVISLLVAIPISAFTPIVFTPIVLIKLIAIGVCAMGGQWFLTLAYSSGSASKVSIINYSSIIFSIVLGFFLLSQVPDRFSIIGAKLIIGAAIISNRARCKNKQ